MPIVVIVFIIEKCVRARGDCLCCARRNFLFKSFISRCMAFRHPVSGICDCPHGNGFCWFKWCLRSLPESFRSLYSGHAQGLGNYPAGGIWLAWADESLPYRGLILPCSIVVLTSTQVLPTDSANCRVRVWVFVLLRGVSSSPTGLIQ